MKCKRAKHEMALHAGRDLDEFAEQELRRHLSSCPDCRDQWHRVANSTSILQQVGTLDADTSSPQLWTTLSRSLDQSSSPRPTSRGIGHVWVPLVAIASLVLAVVSISQTITRPVPRDPDGTLLVTPNDVNSLNTLPANLPGNGFRNYRPQPVDPADNKDETEPQQNLPRQND